MSNVSGLFFVKEFFVMKNLFFWFFLGSNCNVTLSKLKTLFLNSSGLTFDIFYLQFDSLFRIVQFSRYKLVHRIFGGGPRLTRTADLTLIRRAL